jgi:hypothetical protein
MLYAIHSEKGPNIVAPIVSQYHLCYLSYDSVMVSDLLDG